MYYVTATWRQQPVVVLVNSISQNPSEISMIILQSLMTTTPRVTLEILSCGKFKFIYYSTL